MADEKQAADATKPPKPGTGFETIPIVPQPQDPHADKPHTPEGRAILRDEQGRAYTESSPQTGGLRSYLDEAEYPPEWPVDAEGHEIHPPALNVVPPQAAAAAASQFDPAPAPVRSAERPVLQTSTVEPHVAAAGSSVPSFSATQVTAAQAAPPAPAGERSAAAQAVIDATLAHPAAQPGETKGGGQ
jgi:hypothetical protein